MKRLISIYNWLMPLAALQLIRKTVWDEVPLIISRLPRELVDFPPVEDAMGAWITSQLDLIMGEFLVEDSERDLWALRATGGLSPLLWARFDELIIRQTENLGDLIEHSKVVQYRIQCWKVEQGGDDLYRRYNAARDKNMRHLHRRGGALPPVDPGLKQFKTATVAELRIVLEDLRGHFAESRQRIIPAQLLDRFRCAVTERRCGHLQANQPSWETFLAAETRRRSVETLIKRKPASLFDEWAAWATTYKQEVLRQKISLQKL
jgi:hypothetical protein